MSELTKQYDELKPVEATSAADAPASSEWRRRLNAIRTNEFVNAFVTTWMLSVITFGPIPSLGERRNH